MNKETLIALKKSIIHWHKNAYCDENNITRSACALCSLFWYNDCVDCPIYAHSGEDSCKGTPYVKAERAKRQNSSYEVFIMYAIKELAFLVSLLPKGEEVITSDGHTYYWEWEEVYE